MKKRILSLVLVLVLCLALVPAVLPSGQTAAAESSAITDAREKLEQAKKKQQQLQSQLDELKGDKDSYMEQKQLLDQQIAELEEEVSLYDGLIAALDSEIAASEAVIEKARAQYAKNIESFRAQARATYENGPTTYLEVLLGSKSFSDFLLGLEYVKQVSIYERDLLDKITESIRVEEEEMARIEANRAEMSAVRAAVQATLDEVDRKRATVQALLDDLKKDEERYKDALDAAHKQEEELNEWIEKELAGENSDVEYVEGEWIWPVAKARYNYLSSPWGWRTLKGKREFHYAIDIAAPRGTPVLASKSGVVKSAKWVTTGGGYQCCIDHGGTYYTYYNHLNSKPIVSAGQYVTQGQVIGYVGDSGYAFGTHLDFKIYYDGKAVNPAKYVSNPY